MDTWKIMGRRLLTGGFSLKGRSQVERIELYTRGSLYLIFWFFLLLAALNVVALAEGPGSDRGQPAGGGRPRRGGHR